MGVEAGKQISIEYTPIVEPEGVVRGMDRSYRLGETVDVCIHRMDPASSKPDLAPAPGF